MNTLGHHPDQQDRLVGHDPAQVEERIEQVPGEHVAGHVLGRRHVLQRRVREELADQLRVRKLEQERVGHGGVDLERVAEAELAVGQARLLAEELIHQLADHDRVRGVDRVGRRQVVVLAGVDDDAGPGVDLPGEPLVDERPARVDVAEDDAVHAVVQHHVQPLEAGQRGDLRHAQAGGVVREPDVTAELAARLVQRRSHQPEVLLRGVGAGEAFPRRALGHVVQQRLAGRPDHGDDVGALARRGLCLRDVLVDVAGSDDQVDPRLARLGRLPDELLAPGPVRVDLADARGQCRAGGCARRVRVVAGREPECHLALRGRVGQCGQVIVTAGQQRVPGRQRDAVLESGGLSDGIDQAIDPRHAVRVGALQPGQPQHRALDRDRGVRPGHLDDGLAGPGRQLACLADDRRVEVQSGLHALTPECSLIRRWKMPRTPGSVRIRSMAS